MKKTGRYGWNLKKSKCIYLDPKRQLHQSSCPINKSNRRGFWTRTLPKSRRSAELVLRSMQRLWPAWHATLCIESGYGGSLDTAHRGVACMHYACTVKILLPDVRSRVATPTTIRKVCVSAAPHLTINDYTTAE